MDHRSKVIPLGIKMMEGQQASDAGLPMHALWSLSFSSSPYHINQRPSLLETPSHTSSSKDAFKITEAWVMPIKIKSESLRVGPGKSIFSNHRWSHSPKFESPAALVKMQFLTQWFMLRTEKRPQPLGLWVCISNKHTADVDAAGPWTSSSYSQKKVAVITPWALEL